MKHLVVKQNGIFDLKFYPVINKIYNRIKMKHKHHIIPRYEGGNNLQENLVELTTTQHAMWHYAEWTRKKDDRDHLAWKCLSGQIGNEEIQKIKSKIGYDRMKEVTKNQPHPGTKLKGRKQSEEHKMNRSKALKGKICCSPEAIERMRQTKRKLTDEQVRQIKSSSEKGVVLANKYKVAPSLICQIRKGKASGYKHII
jgi:hypothetical protein